MFSTLCATASNLAGNVPRCFAAQRESALWQMAVTDGGFCEKSSYENHFQNVYAISVKNKNSKGEERDNSARKNTAGFRAAFNPLTVDFYLIEASFYLFWCCKFLFVEKCYNLCHAGSNSLHFCQCLF